MEIYFNRYIVRVNTVNKIDFDYSTSIFSINDKKVIKTPIPPNLPFWSFKLKHQKKYIFDLYVVINIDLIYSRQKNIHPDHFQIIMHKYIKNKIRKKHFNQNISNNIHNSFEILDNDKFEIKNGYIYDIVLNKLYEKKHSIISPFMSSKRIEPNKKRINGGIILTNNLTNTIKELIDTFKNTIVVADTIFHQLWKKIFNDSGEIFPNISYIGFDQLLNINDCDRLIIHESTPDVMNLILILQKNKMFFNIPEIWIINTLPLNYYFKKSSLDISILKSIFEIWIKNPEVIVKEILFNLDKIYFINKTNPVDDLFDIELNQYPIYKYFKKYIDKIKNSSIKLHACENIVHLLSTISDENTFRTTLFKLKLYASTTNEQFQLKIQNAISKSRDLKTTLKLKKILNSAVKNKELIKNHTIIGIEKGCVICLRDNVNSHLMMICGHSMCIECSLECISVNRKCPMCRCNINLFNSFIIDNNLKPAFNFDDKTLIISKFKSPNILRNSLRDIYKILDLDLKIYARVVFICHYTDKLPTYVISYLNFLNIPVTIMRVFINDT